MTTVVHVMQGLPASGKSTLARALADADSAFRFNLDDIRAMMGITGENWSKENEAVAFRVMMDGIVRAVDAGRNVVVDNTHMTPRIPNAIRRRLALRDVDYDVHSFINIEVDECVRRDAGREASVGENVIRGMWAKFNHPQYGGWNLTTEWMREGLCKTQPYKEDPALPYCIIVDIDGTLALHNGRGPYDFAKCYTDVLNPAVASVIEGYASIGTKVVFLSGRQSEYREMTASWLEANLDPVVWSVDPPLLMRPIGDRRADYMVKRDLFESEILGRYNVFTVMDDRDQVVELWRRGYGLPCWQVAYGEF